MHDRLLDEWTQAARDLDLDIQSPCLLHLESGANIRARLLLKNYGAAKGMLVVTDYETIAPFADEIVAAEYGFSTLSEPSDRSHYDREVFVEMLRDWGWSGPETLRPEWCLPLDDREEESGQND